MFYINVYGVEDIILEVETLKKTCKFISANFSSIKKIT